MNKLSTKKKSNKINQKKAEIGNNEKNKLEVYNRQNSTSTSINNKNGK